MVAFRNDSMTIIRGFVHPTVGEGESRYPIYWLHLMNHGWLRGGSYVHETDNLQLYLYFLRPAAWNQVVYSNHFSPTFLKPWLKLEDQDPTAHERGGNITVALLIREHSLDNSTVDWTSYLMVIIEIDGIVEDLVMVRGKEQFAESASQVRFNWNSGPRKFCPYLPLLS